MAEAKASGLEPKVILFGAGKTFVQARTGKSDDASRKLIGGWCKGFADDHVALIDALAEAERQPRVHLESWMGGVIKRRKGETQLPPPRNADEVRAQMQSDPMWAGVRIQ